MRREADLERPHGEREGGRVRVLASDPSSPLPGSEPSQVSLSASGAGGFIRPTTIF